MNGAMTMMDDAKVVELPTVLDLNAASPLRDRLLARRGTPLALDASRVERIGGQCLQVLLAARNAWQRDGASFSIDRPSDGFLNAVRQMGFAGDLTPATETTR
ncbi:Chemotaxis protein CheX (modular protein) [Rhizobium sp. EC-SD404]|nr:Chemotaxis protein CheX (modular protein) [Rhizobium sp. EC-SD404]